MSNRIGLTCGCRIVEGVLHPCPRAVVLHRDLVAAREARRAGRGSMADERVAYTAFASHLNFADVQAVDYADDEA